ncbi:acetyltransferase [Sporomusa acidovorans]|uniref:UDP-3-O-(3-hydroxymyristoyl)glucosamine N-acyltransferase n=2 Tax=Sporomusa TaxID=2375 RepID=A0ABZ3J7C6_SPOA4|nr:acetyltransferase [Sporomusa acidovorans]OZC13777.1 UDP-N-acetylbacillosamine N-acetyltransferase [Sporomusa acidovorans DSM 3132]SDE48803.1 sugar O-acyltransferase, sialic acid O-acetyltransferase NeuD family [Sporomusa acidovorans]
MQSREDIVIVGLGEIAEIAMDYFSYDSPYKVVAFSAESSYIKDNTFLGLPIVELESITDYFSPKTYKIFVAIGYDSLNRGRARLYQKCKEKGYSFVSYISSKAFIGSEVEIGENCFILEHNVVQRKAKIGNDVTLWSGNHIGHRTVIEDHCFFSSHIAISGYCRIGSSCFWGINSCAADHVAIASDCLIGAGTVVLSDTSPGKVYRGNPAKAAHISSYSAFGIKMEE